MKKRILITTLILSGLLLSACGNSSEKPSSSSSETPTSSETSSEAGSSQGGQSSGGESSGGSGSTSQGGSESTSQGGGSQGGSESTSQGGESSGGSSSSQGGGEGEGGEGESHSTIGENFINKKLVYSSIETEADAATKASLEEEYAGATVSFFNDATFEMVAHPGTGIAAIIGSYTLPSETRAELAPFKMYDSEYSQYGYSYEIDDSMSSLVVDFDGSTDYTLPMVTETLSSTLHYTVHLVASADFPERADLPNDPNGDSFDKQYQVGKYAWTQVFNPAGYAGGLNFTLVDDGYVFQVSDNLIHFENTALAGSETYRKINSPIYDTDGTTIIGYSTDSYHLDSNSQWVKYTDVEIYYDVYVREFGFLPLAFENVAYDHTNHFYEKSSFKYTDSSNVSHTILNFRAYFSNGKISRIIFTESGVDYEYNFTNQGTTVVNLPSMPSTDPNDYYEEMTNRVFTFKEAWGSGFNDEQIALVNGAYDDAELSFFNDHSVQFHCDKKVNGTFTEATNEPWTYYGTFSLNEYTPTYIRGNISITHVYDGTEYTAHEESFPIRYQLDNNEIRMQLGGNKYYQFSRTDTVPTPIPHPDPSTPVPASWPSDVIATYLIGIGATSTTIPALDGASDYSHSQSGDVLTITCEFDSVTDADDARYAYMTSLSSDFEMDINTLTYHNSEVEISIEYDLVDQNINVITIKPYEVPTPVDTYPTEELSTWATANHISDTIPELRVDGAEYTGTPYDDDGYFFIEYDLPSGKSIDEAQEELIAILEDSSNNLLYFAGSYNSENGDYCIIINASYVLTVAIWCNGITKNYPSAKMEEYLSGMTITDSLLAPVLEGTNVYYCWEWEMAMVPYSSLYVMEEGEGQDYYDDLVGHIVNDLLDDGFGIKISDTYGEVFVSQDKDFGVSFEADSTQMTIHFFNYNEYPEDLIVEYRFYYDDNESNLFEYGPLFYAWVWGGRYGTGEWIELSLEDDGYFYPNDPIYDDATGIIIVRMNPDGDEPSWDRGWNKTDDIDISGNQTTFHVQVLKNNCD